MPENIIALAGIDVVNAFGEADLIKDDQGEGFLDAGPGLEIVDGGSEDDTIVGGEGDDRFEANPGNDSMFGDLGNDIISGSIGDDNLVGNEGDDDFCGGPGKDQLWCDSIMNTRHDYNQPGGDKIISEGDCKIVKPFPEI